MSKAIKEKSGLKLLAADAKERLKSGYHNRETTEKSESYYEVVKKSFPEREDKKERLFYENVKKLLAEEDCLNPISRLVDQEYLSTLSYSSRQRYLLEISEKYNKAKNEILSQGIKL